MTGSGLAKVEPPQWPARHGWDGMTPVILIVMLLAPALLPAPAAAAGEPVASGVVREIVDGDTLVLEGGTQVRLVGIQAPKLPLGRPGFPTWPLAHQAKAALAALTLGKRLTLVYTGRRVDRYGRLLAHLSDAAGQWIQGVLLARGMARVYTFADNRARAAEMLSREREARAAGRGIWAHPFYRVLHPEGVGRLTGTFQLVEGRIVKAAVVRGRGYLNFGRDWKTDFTVTVAPRDMRRFKGRGNAIRAFEGRLVRVRGWIRSFNGPMIEATHPEQIELILR